MIQRCSFCSQASGDSWYEAQKVWLVQKEGFTLGEWVHLCVGVPVLLSLPPPVLGQLDSLSEQGEEGPR